MTKSEIINFVKDVRVEHDVRIAAKYVAKETGKGLSTNDYTTAEKTKLTGVETGAQVNVLEGISIVGGAALEITTDTKIANLDLSAYALKSEVAGALIYKGSKDTFDELPASGNSNGDVWNVKIAGGTDRYGTDIKAGDNVVWIEDTLDPGNSGWDVQGGTTDLSGYVEVETGKGLSTNDFTTAYKDALDSLVSGSAETFSNDDISEIFNDN